MATTNESLLSDSQLSQLDESLKTVMDELEKPFQDPVLKEAWGDYIGMGFNNELHELRRDLDQDTVITSTDSLLRLLKDSKYKLSRFENSDIEVFSPVIKSLRNFIDTLTLTVEICNYKKELRDYLEKTIVKDLNNSNRSFQKELKGIESRFTTQIEDEKDSVLEISGTEKESIRTIANKLRNETINSIGELSSSKITEIQEAHVTSIGSFREVVHTQASELTQEIGYEKKAIEKVRTELERILGAISEKALAYDNIEQAKKERKRADILQRLGFVILMGAALIFLLSFDDLLTHIYSNFKTLFSSNTIIEAGIKQTAAEVVNKSTASDSDSAYELVWFLKRFLTIVLLSSPAIYLLRESASHRAKEHVYRQRGTQLATIGSYLEDMDSSERVQVKKELLNNFFTVHDGKADTTNVPDLIRDLKEVVNMSKAASKPSFFSRKK